MKHRFLLHSLSHTLVVVDITSFGLPTEIYPREGQRQTAPAFRFPSWNDVERCFLALGGDGKAIENAFASIQTVGLAVLTIL